MVLKTNEEFNLPWVQILLSPHYTYIICCSLIFKIVFYNYHCSHDFWTQKYTRNSPVNRIWNKIFEIINR